jgi:hypothetical protein
VARFYRSNLRQNAPVSTEITGYAVSAMLFLFERTADSAYLDAGLRAARFLTRAAWDRQAATFPFEIPASGTAAPAFTYFFDCGIIVRGLLAAWRATADTEFRDVAIAAGRSMLVDFPSPASIHPVLELPAKRPLAWEARWSAGPGCYQLKSAMAWQELFEITGESAFARGYESALEGALLNDPEFLPGSPDPHRVVDRLHAYAYFLEGLLPVLDRPECAAAFRSGIDRAARYLREIAPLFARSDVYAQILRARLFGESLGVLPLDEPAAAHEAEQAASFQIRNADPASDPQRAGGFLFGRKEGEDLPFVNPVSTAFCLQALAMWTDRSAQLGPKSSVI